MTASCPSCGEADRVDEINAGPLPDRWLCGRCNMIYCGGDDEWAQWTNRRRRRRAELERQGQAPWTQHIASVDGRS